MANFKVKVYFRQPEITPDPRTRDYLAVTEWEVNLGVLELSFAANAEFVAVNIPMDAIERVEISKQPE